jgi:hypothetical protein
LGAGFVPAAFGVAPFVAARPLVGAVVAARGSLDDAMPDGLLSGGLTTPGAGVTTGTPLGTGKLATGWAAGLNALPAASA